MACYSPLHGFKGPVNENGKRPIVWRAPAGSEKQVVQCGKCIGCRLRYAKHWASRCMHEAQMYERNCFVTLTFDEDRLPPYGFLDVSHVQLFLKRLRKQYGAGIRFFAAGEYGSKFGRPHYHALLFNHDFPDKLLKVERFGNRVYESESLKALWPYGFHSIGDVSYASASYVARYCVKKVGADVEYIRDEETGTRLQVDPKSGDVKPAEFVTMSRGCKKLGTGGIGYSWFKKFKSDVFPSDEVIVNGRPDKPPRFYDNLLDREDPDLLDTIKLARMDSMSYSENTDSRLLVREQVQLSQIKAMVRTL